MSDESVEIIRRCMEMFSNRDLSRLEDLVDPEVVLDLSRNVFNPGVYHGFDGVGRWLEESEEMWEQLEAMPEEFIAAGDQVVGAVRLVGQGRDGVEVEMRLFQVWTLREGKVVSVVGGYRDRAEALEAARLS